MNNSSRRSSGALANYQHESNNSSDCDNSGTQSSISNTSSTANTTPPLTYQHLFTVRRHSSQLAGRRRRVYGTHFHATVAHNVSSAVHEALHPKQRASAESNYTASSSSSSSQEINNNK